MAVPCSPQALQDMNEDEEDDTTLTLTVEGPADADEGAPSGGGGGGLRGRGDGSIKSMSSRTSLDGTSLDDEEMRAPAAPQRTSFPVQAPPVPERISAPPPDEYEEEAAVREPHLPACLALPPPAGRPHTAVRGTFDALGL